MYALWLVCKYTSANARYISKQWDLQNFQTAQLLKWLSRALEAIDIGAIWLATHDFLLMFRCEGFNFTESSANQSDASTRIALVHFWHVAVVKLFTFTDSKKISNTNYGLRLCTCVFIIQPPAWSTDVQPHLILLNIKMMISDQWRRSVENSGGPESMGGDGEGCGRRCFPPAAEVHDSTPGKFRSKSCIFVRFR